MGSSHRLRAAWGMALGVALLGSCARGGPPGAVLSEVHDARLRAHMGRLEQVAIQDLSDATRGPSVREDLARVADDLQGIAARLPDVAGTLQLSEEDRSRFVAFADSLRASAGELGTTARSGDGPAIRARIDEVTNACAACHWAYRAGPED